MSPALREAVVGFAHTQKTIWLALTLSILLYGIVLLVLLSLFGTATDGADDAFFWMALTMSVLLAVAAVAFRRYSFSDGRLRQLLERPSVGGPQPQAPLDASDATVFSGLAKLQPSWIVSWGVHEGIALLGLVAGILTRDFAVFLPFAALALLLNLATYPRPQDVAERLSALASK